MASQGSPLSIFKDLPIRGDRRRSVRHKAHSPAYASFNGMVGGMVLDLSEILNLSETGMAIQATTPLPLDRDLNIVLDLSETKAYINTSGVIVWSDKAGRAGIRFSRIPDPSLRLMKEWFFVNCLVALSKEPDSAPAIEHPVPGMMLGSTLAEKKSSQSAAFHESTTPTAFAEHRNLAASAFTLSDLQREIEALGSDTESALRLLANQARMMTRASGAALALASGTEMVCRASSGDAPPVGARFHAGSGFSGACVRTATLQRCDDSEVDSSVDRETCRLLGVRSMIATPVIANGTVIGLLEVFSPEAHCFHDSDSATLRRLAEITAHSVRVSVLSEFEGNAGTEPPPIPFAEPEFEIQGGYRENWLVGLSRSKAFLITVAVLLVVGIGAVEFASRIWHPPVAAAVSPPETRPAAQDQPAQAPAGTLDDLRKYAAQGDPVAQYALGARYHQGDGVKQDDVEAVRWFEQAAEKGHVVAQATLGAYYWAGRGVPQDLNKAYFWSALARAGGDEASKYRVAALTSRMSRSQVLQAQQLAEDWLHTHQAAAGSNQ
jgi:putative methionine-R-sulfoxide reductase with GAF domain